MQRFILQENVALLQRRLTEAADAGLCRTLRSLLLSAQRELALFDAASSGIGTGLTPPGSVQGQFSRDAHTVRQFRRRFDRSPRACLALHPGPGLHIVDINDAYARATMTARACVAGQRLFDIFPDNPDDASADGARNLYASLRIAAETGRPHAMDVQRYDVRDPTGHFVERYWRPRNTPVFDDEGRLTYLLHHVEDVTGEVLSLSRQPAVADP
jgi:PAS domain-containing protein